MFNVSWLTFTCFALCTDQLDSCISYKTVKKLYYKSHPAALLVPFSDCSHFVTMIQNHLLAQVKLPGRGKPPLGEQV